MSRYLIDALDLGHNTKGITRVLSNLVPSLLARSHDEILIASTSEGREILAGIGAAQSVVVSRPLQSRWEQWDLPRLARERGADAVYSHRECGPLWGPPVVLHVPEDPEVRWERDPPRSARDRARRAYSRLLLRRSLRHAGVVAASTPSAAAQLEVRYGLPARSVTTIPLGVDLELFHPAEAPAGDSIFHLGSSDPRDRTVLVVEAWSAARAIQPSLPRLVLGGHLGEVEAAVRRRARELEVELEVTGRLDDADLAARYRNAALVVQPSSDEGFGLQPLEALASGAPLVVTRADVVSDVVGGAAIVCEAEVGALSEAIFMALADPVPRRAAGRQRAEGYSWDSTSDAVLTSLARASASRHAPAT
jgi:glycosyltransferase involved in cell wall biosynthesis